MSTQVGPLVTPFTENIMIMSLFRVKQVVFFSEKWLCCEVCGGSVIFFIAGCCSCIRIRATCQNSTCQPGDFVCGTPTSFKTFSCWIDFMKHKYNCIFFYVSTLRWRRWLKLVLMEKTKTHLSCIAVTWPLMPWQCKGSGHQQSWYVQWNLSVTTTSIIKSITCDLFSNVF